MPLRFVDGDPLLTRADVLAFGHNKKGRTEMDVFTTTIMRRYPAAFSAYTRQARRGRLSGGDIFIWSQTTPKLLFGVVRDSSVGATRLRYVQKLLITLARDYQLYNVTSLAIAPLGSQYERADVELLYPMWLKDSALPVIIYQDYVPDVEADEDL